MLTELLAIARARLSYLNGQMATATAIGDAARIAVLQSDIAAVEHTIGQLEALS